MIVTLSRWLKIATPDEATRLAKLAKTSVKSLRHIVAGRRKGSADTAIRVAAASRKVETVAEEIDQGSICPACHKCPFYRKTL